MIIISASKSLIRQGGINIFREEFNSRCFKMQNILQISHHFTNQITLLLLFSPFIILKSEKIDRSFVIFQPDRISCKSLMVWLLLRSVRPLCAAGCNFSRFGAILLGLGCCAGALSLLSLLDCVSQSQN